MKAEGNDAAEQVCIRYGESPTPVLEGEGVSAPRAWSIRTSLRPFVKELVGHGREYAATFITEFVVMGSQIVTYKLAAHYLGREGFSEYALARRTASLVYPPILLGFGVALPRYIGLTNGARDPGKAPRYLGAALKCVGLAGLVALLLMNLFREGTGYLFFGSRSYFRLMTPLSLVVFGLALHAVGYSYFRGNLRMKEANGLQLVNLGVVPLAGFLFFRTSLWQLLFAVGSLTIGVALIGLALTPWRSVVQSTSSEAGELLRYGLQRVPGDFVHTALLTLPATFAAHLTGMRAAGNVSFGVSMLSVVTALFTPIGLILLPKASRMLAEGTRTDLRRHVVLVTKAAIVISAALTLALIVLAGPAIRLYLGPGYADAALVVRILILGAVPYSVFLVLRNVIDAAHETAVTALILIAGFAAFCVGSGIFSSLSRNSLGILLAMLAGLFVLGVLASRQTVKILAERRA